MTENQDKCPTLEELQEFSCGVPDMRIEGHLKSCEKCQEVVRKEKSLNAILDDYMSPPADLNDRILLACQEAQDEDSFLVPEVIRKHRPSFLRSWYPYAAAAAILLVGFFIGVSIPQPGRTFSAPTAYADASDMIQPEMAYDFVAEAEAPAGNEEMAMLAKAAPEPLMAAAPALAHMARAKKAMSMAYGGAVDSVNAEIPVVPEIPYPSSGMIADKSEGFSLEDSLAMTKGRSVNQDVMTVSTRNPGVHSHRKAKSQPVNDEVTHVWVADDLPSTAEFQAFVQQNNGEVCTPPAIDKDGILTISLLASDEEVQQLTDGLYGDKHWKLLSPSAPQPNLASRTVFNGHPVKYNIKVVPNN